MEEGYVKETIRKFLIFLHVKHKFEISFYFNDILVNKDNACRLPKKIIIFIALKLFSISPNITHQHPSARHFNNSIHNDVVVKVVAIKEILILFL